MVKRSRLKSAVSRLVKTPRTGQHSPNDLSDGGLPSRQIYQAVCETDKRDIHLDRFANYDEVASAALAGAPI